MRWIRKKMRWIRKNLISRLYSTSIEKGELKSLPKAKKTATSNLPKKESIKNKLKKLAKYSPFQRSVASFVADGLGTYLLAERFGTHVEHSPIIRKLMETYGTVPGITIASLATAPLLYLPPFLLYKKWREKNYHDIYLDLFFGTKFIAGLVGLVSVLTYYGIPYYITLSPLAFPYLHSLIRYYSRKPKSSKS